MKAMGRPVEGKEAKVSPLSMRTAPALRAKLEAAANARGHSLAKEVEFRIRRSFEVDDLLARLVEVFQR